MENAKKIKNFVTKEGMEKIKKELQELKTIKRQEISRRIQEAKELGDLSENAEYAEAKEARALNEKRIAEIEIILRDAETISIQPSMSDVVQIGSTIVVQNGNNKEKVFTIVGSNEANPVEGKISNESPLGTAFLGRKPGEEIDIKIPNGAIKYKIVKIK